MYDFKKEEERILRLWKSKKIYSKSKKKNAKGKKFYMMDGPPYATGHIHMGTALNKILKDIAMRTRRLQGFNVFDRAGYDTHGVPIEYQIEKEIGSKSKQDIEKYGVKKFIEKCKEFATRYIGVMNSEFGNLGVWMDFENPYLTLDNKYIETIWDTFKQADKKKLLYLGKYPIHICPRCETAVAYNEIEYAKQEDTSIYVKFELKKNRGKYLLIWTTTPWTLPGNTGVMVNPNFDYAEVEVDIDNKKEIWIMARELVEKIMSKFGYKYKIKKMYKGKEMKGWEYYNPLVEHLKLKLKNAYKVVLSSRYVNLEEGTGLVHCAPGHGKEDYEVGKECGLDMPSPVLLNGMMSEEAGKYAGKRAREVDEEIIRDLDEEKMLAHKEGYVHDYPLCWRCKSALLMVSQPQWFLKISEIHKKILSENEKTNWVPSWMKLRMKAWLEGISDWPVSRRRYWGTPLPIWICEKCKERKVIGSVKELEELSGRKIKELHKPEIDRIKLKCSKCKGEMKRVNEVLDVWFDSGVSSWAALDKKQFKKFWPADLNLEGKDQVRGWWNSQIILSEIKFDKKPFENILVHGMVLDLGKRKMSKSLGNIVAPADIINRYGRDFMRYYFAKIAKGEDFVFDEKEFNEIQNAFRVLTNINNFVNQLNKKKGKLQIEDKWILSRFNSAIKEVIESYNSYKFSDAVVALEKFMIFDLSKTYIQIIRERADETYEILNEIRENLLKLLAPIIPFITESIWQELRDKKIVKEESVHLCLFPKTENKKINKKLEKEMEEALRIIEAGMAERDRAKIGLKWPLSKAIIKIKSKISRELEEIIARQLNVKKIETSKSKDFDSAQKSEISDIKTGKETTVELDMKITPELEAEGFAREISRNIQAERKNKGLIKKDKINLIIITDDKTARKIKNFENFIKERTNSKKIKIITEIQKTKEDFVKVIIKDIEFNIAFSRI